MKLERLTESQIQKETKTLRLVPTAKTPRLNVSWIPAPSTTHENSADALAALDQYRQQNGVVPRIDGKNVIRQRSKSIFAENVCQSNSSKSCNVNEITIEDLNREFTEKYNTPNRGLKASSSWHRLAGSQPKQLSECYKIRDEFRTKLAAKKSTATPPTPPPLPPQDNKPKLSWNQMKALETKKYPVVQCVVAIRRTNANGFSSSHMAVTQNINNFLL